jgi:UV damage endonuclease UvdE
MRIGFACKYVHPDQSLPKKHLKEIEGRYNMRSTTATRCRNDPDWQDLLWEIAEHNAQCIINLVEYVSSLPKMAHMVRISSDVLPLYTHVEFQHFYKRKDVRTMLAKCLAPAGQLARDKDIRLSFHPGQFCVLASDRPDVVENSILEFEYHTDVAKYMGYCKSFQDFKCNVHLSGKGGVEQFRKTFKKLSPEARNILTIENDEYSAGLDYVLFVSDIVPIVLDIHHNWINTGNYIRPSDPRVRQVLDSWQGKRPTMHYSYSREEVLLSAGHKCKYTNPNMDKLLKRGAVSGKLRAHSDFYPNVSANRWALSFLPEFDIMCESKMKNLASLELIEFYRSIHASNAT